MRIWITSFFAMLLNQNFCSLLCPLLFSLASLLKRIGLVDIAKR